MVAEALACRLPVAITNQVNVAADVASAEAGIVHFDTVESTLSALRKWLDITTSDRVRIGENGYRLFNERFNLTSVSKNLIPVLDAAINADTKK